MRVKKSEISANTQVHNEIDYLIEFPNKVLFQEHKAKGDLASFLANPNDFIDFRRTIKRNIHLYAEQVAIRCLDATMTYRQLGERARKICNYLFDQKINKGDVVAIYLPSHMDLVPSLLAVMQLGATFILLNDPTKDRNEQRLQHCLKITHEEYCQKNDKKLILLAFNESGLTSLSLQQEQQKLFYKKIFVEQAESESDDFIKLEPISKDSLAYITFTSGSTGKPKGVLIPYEGIYARVAAHITLEEYKITEKDVFSQFCPIDVDAAILEILIPLLSGGQLVLTPHPKQEDLNELVQYYSEKNVTVSIFTPTVLKALQRLNLKVKTHKLIFTVGEDVATPLLDYFAGNNENGNQKTTLVNGYGPCEASIATSLAPYKKEEGVHIGKAILGVTMELWHGKNKLVPQDGVEGEIVIGGLGVGLGYIGASPEDEERFFKIGSEKFYRTGDEGKYTKDKSTEEFNIKFLGRQLADQFKRGGHLVRVEEIKAELDKVLKVPHQKLKKIIYSDESIVVYLDLTDEKDRAAPQETINQIATRLKNTALPTYMFPARWIMPNQTGNWKGETKTYLAHNIQDYVCDDKSKELKQIELEMIALWEGVLLSSAEISGDNRLHLKASDDFFVLGGASVEYNVMVTKFKKKFGLEFPRELFLANPTIESLVRYVRRSQLDINKIVGLLNKKTQDIGRLNEQTKSLVDNCEHAPLICMHALLGSDTNYGELAQKFSDRLLFGLSSWGLQEIGLLPINMQEMAYSYLDVIRKIKSSGPYLLVGWSFIFSL